MVINRIMCTLKALTDLKKKKKRNENKKYFCKSCLQCFSSKNMLTEHKNVCLSINDAQSLRLENVTTDLKIISNKYQFHLKFMLILSAI